MIWDVCITIRLDVIFKKPSVRTSLLTGSVLEHRQIKLLFLDRLTARYTKPDWTPYWTTPLKTTTEFVFVKECELAKMQLILNVDLDFLTDHHLLSP